MYISSFHRDLFLFFLSFVFSISLSAQQMFEWEREFVEKENYNYEELDFINTEEGIKLSGTLITPKTSFDKIVMIVPGSGQDTRYSHFILAEELVKNGIAVYRFDERGVGTSEGSYSPFSSDLSSDTYYGYLNLRKEERFKHHKIGILGHSLGGRATINTYAKEPNIDFLLFMATPVIKHGNNYKYQASINLGDYYHIKGHSQEEMVQLIDTINSIIVTYDSPKKAKKEARKVARSLGFKNSSRKNGYGKFLTNAYIDVTKEDNEETYRNIRVPSFYFIGGGDEHVNPIEDPEFLRAMQNPFIKIKVYPKLNHWLTEEGLPIGASLYQMDGEVMNDIIEWIKQQ